jgi:polar amino acid transport system permease protein
MTYTWRFDVVLAELPLLLGGLWLTVALTALSMLVGIVIGLLAAVARASRWPIVGWPAYAYTEAFRTTPILVQIVWVFWVLPLVGGVTLSPFAAGLVALSLNVGAFVAETCRAGLLSIAPGQREAALALGMTGIQALRRVLLPQAVRRVIPPLATVWVSLFKDTSIVSAIGVTELMYQARTLATETYRPLEVFTIVALLYFVITYPQSLGVNRLYNRLRTQE